ENQRVAKPLRGVRSLNTEHLRRSKFLRDHKNSLSRGFSTASTSGVAAQFVANSLDEAKRNPGLFAETRVAIGVARPIKRYMPCGTQSMDAVPSLVAKHGGRYLYQTSEYERIEETGESPSLVVLIEWPDKASAERCYSDPVSQPHKQTRQNGAVTVFLIPAGS
ncbi:MAG: DUF1330 domain-containing protein, partial [Pseudomonadota bacterium]